MKFYIKCLIDFRGPRKVVVRGPEDASNRELTQKIMKIYPSSPITNLEVIKKERENQAQEFWTE
jgi:hypothetical protein